jgi:chloramphenicol O-acetyltransferase type A
VDNFERRRDRFDLFDRMDSPAVNLSFTLELPDFRPWCKANALPAFHVLLCAMHRAVMKIENFRWRIHQGEVFAIDRLIPSFTVINQHNDLNFAMFEWSDDLRTYVARSKAAGEAASNTVQLNDHYRALPPREAKHQVFVTCIPWLNLTSIQHPIAALDCPDIPSLAWGKFRDGAPGELLLPFSVQAHHGFVDGFHIHLLAQGIAAELAAIMAGD